MKTCRSLRHVITPAGRRAPGAGSEPPAGRESPAGRQSSRHRARAVTARGILVLVLALAACGGIASPWAVPAANAGTGIPSSGPRPGMAAGHARCAARTPLMYPRPAGGPKMPWAYAMLAGPQAPDGRCGRQVREETSARPRGLMSSPLYS
jgi:hypothetical protein